MSFEYLTTSARQNIEANSMQEVLNFHFIDSFFEYVNNTIYDSDLRTQLGQNKHKDILLDKTIPLGPIEFEQTIKCASCFSIFIKSKNVTVKYNSNISIKYTSRKNCINVYVNCLKRVSSNHLSAGEMN
uniref:Uncharacterized protein n=1 Tax=Glossina austeni TaxID=7395 RepID=A0A1A9UTK1_GLOAU